MIEDRFEDRVDAGRVLGAAMRDFDVPRDAIVVGLPRGGVPVAAEVARALDLPLDLIVVRKLGLPMQRELAMGAIASGGGGGGGDGGGCSAENSQGPWLLALGALGALFIALRSFFFRRA